MNDAEWRKAAAYLGIPYEVLAGAIDMDHVQANRIKNAILEQARKDMHMPMTAEERLANASSTIELQDKAIARLKEQVRAARDEAAKHAITGMEKSDRIAELEAAIAQHMKTWAEAMKPWNIDLDKERQRLSDDAALMCGTRIRAGREPVTFAPDANLRIQLAEAHGIIARLREKIKRTRAYTCRLADITKHDLRVERKIHADELKARDNQVDALAARVTELQQHPVQVVMTPPVMREIIETAMQRSALAQKQWDTQPCPHCGKSRAEHVAKT